ncbi:MAG TPA: HEAT repeat domain-containing protein [Polyangiaceae bacterium]|jgi:HEAT repeat protein|nr:HEAT repeat domain-containing protein [Polyangiaceae bacterium]
MSVTTIARALRRGGWQARVRALEAARCEKSEVLLPIVVTALHDREDLVVATAIECLVDWDAKETVAALSELLHAASELTRAYAAWALGRLGSREHLPRLRRLMGDDGQVVASAAAEACFCLTGTKKYERFLLDQLASSDPEARAFTASSLVGIATDGNTSTLIRHLRAAARKERLPAIREAMRANLKLLDK